MPRIQPLKRQVTDHRIDMDPDVRLVAAHGGRPLGAVLPGQGGVQPLGGGRARLAGVLTEFVANGFEIVDPDPDEFLGVELYCPHRKWEAALDEWAAPGGGPQ
jgi:hypothetical protein